MTHDSGGDVLTIQTRILTSPFNIDSLSHHQQRGLGLCMQLLRVPRWRVELKKAAEFLGQVFHPCGAQKFKIKEPLSERSSPECS